MDNKRKREDPTQRTQQLHIFDVAQKVLQHVAFENENACDAAAAIKCKQMEELSIELSDYDLLELIAFMGRASFEALRKKIKSHIAILHVDIFRHIAKELSRENVQYENEALDRLFQGEFLNPDERDVFIKSSSPEFYEKYEDRSSFWRRTDYVIRDFFITHV